ncbi:inositol monophosphatase family protein [Namhaeicola litoreus]|uniref:Inositol monophosphatase family protein n=1 Tax=Namhaeicola litoreus TaxID=1052145 RepID=A0ABW3Y0L1_9FLAO
MMNYQHFIYDSLDKVSKIARDNFGKVSSITKPEDNNQVLTKTDLEIGKLLIRAIEKKFPSHNIIDEEAGVIHKNSDFTWVIDPIDGTSNFANASPLYGCMFGLLLENKPIAGGIALPFYSDIITAAKGLGTFCNEKRIYVSQEKKLSNCLIAYGIDGHQENPEFTRSECELLAEIVLNIRNLRSSNSVFDIALVARGSYGAFLNRTSKVWDNVAQQIIIEEAGGMYTDFFGHQIDYSNTIYDPNKNFSFMAASTEIHGQLLKIVDSYHSK